MKSTGESILFLIPESILHAKEETEGEIKGFKSSIVHYLCAQVFIKPIDRVP